MDYTKLCKVTLNCTEKIKEELIKDPSVQEMPVQSLITNPSANDLIAAAKSGFKSIKVKGVAWGGGGQGISRVDVSLDNGNNFTRAELIDRPIEQRRRSQWSWIFFEKTIPIPGENMVYHLFDLLKKDSLKFNSRTH